jgi:hypothetical protein
MWKNPASQKKKPNKKSSQKKVQYEKIQYKKSVRKSPVQKVQSAQKVQYKNENKFTTSIIVSKKQPACMKDAEKRKAERIHRKE